MGLVLDYLFPVERKNTMKIKITPENYEQAIRENWLEKAAKVVARHCPALTEIHAPKAAVIDVWNCPSLKRGSK